jgi:hypothetical protein
MDDSECKPYLISIKNLISFYYVLFILAPDLSLFCSLLLLPSARPDFSCPRFSISAARALPEARFPALRFSAARQIWRVFSPSTVCDDLWICSPGLHFLFQHRCFDFRLVFGCAHSIFARDFFLLARCWQNLVFGPPFRFSVSSPGLVFDSAPPELFSCSFSRLAAASPPALILAAGARSSIPAAAARFLFAAARTRFPQQDFCAARDCFGARQSNLISCRSHSADFLRLPALSSSSPSQPSSSTAAAEDFSIRLVLGSAAGTRSPRLRHADLFPAHSLPP